MSVNEFTDKDIPISCGECGVYCEGLDDTVYHILDQHRNYLPAEARKYADLWMKDAYERIEQEAVDYAYEQSRRKPHATA